MKKTIALLALLICQVASANLVIEKARTEWTENGKNVFGTDNRYFVHKEYLPYSAVGKITFKTRDGRQAHCTGTLIGRDLVLTNSHCVYDQENGEFYKDITFHPNFMKGEFKISSKSKHIWHGRSSNRINSSRDYAFIKLKSPLGDIFGKLDIDFGTSLYSLENTELKLIGYSGDRFSRTAGAHEGCKFRKELTSYVFLHDCDSMGGSSGSAILDKYNYIVGLHFAHFPGDGDFSNGDEYEDKYGNIAHFTSTFKGTYNLVQNSSIRRNAYNFSMCNFSNKKTIYGAFAYRKLKKNGKKSKLISQGWYKIKKNTCIERELDNIYNDEIYLYAETANGSSSWNGSDESGSDKFCIHKKNGFNYKGLWSKWCLGFSKKKKVFFKRKILKDKTNYIRLI